MNELSGRFLDRLRRAAGDGQVSIDPADCWTYGQDNSRRHHPPDAVVFGTDTRQVQAIVQACHEAGVPLTARGRGTGTAGGSVPVAGGVVLSLERMTRLFETDPANRLMRVETGIVNQAVQAEAARHGFFWAPDPTSAAYCTVGGNIAHNAAGPRALKYGATRENVLGLTAVTGDGRLIHTGGRTSKQATGYDLTRLLIGSEGTLAIVTEATLRLIPLPAARRTLQAVYRDIASATTAVTRIMAQPVTPCALEFIDAAAIAMIRDYSSADLPTDAGALLMIDVDGTDSRLDADVEAIRRAATVDGLRRITAARDTAESEALWATRKALSPALRTLAPNKLNEDVVVPVSRIPELIAGLERLSREFRIPIVNFGHAGNGNIHVNLLYDTQDPVQEKNALPCLSRVFDLVLALDGTLSGEHGIGLAKRDYLDRAIDADTLALMRALKREFDPKGILNPGKLFAE
jgi:D-lactate dehydrogenase